MGNYNGHPSWAYWNVSLWIGNDEGLYNLARDCIRHTRTRDQAVEVFKQYLKDAGITRTPDGARYSKSAIRHAMRGM